MPYFDLSEREYIVANGLFFHQGTFQPGIHVDGTVAHPAFRVTFERIEDAFAVGDLLGWERPMIIHRLKYG